MPFILRRKKNDVLKEWYAIYPERFNNKTNGITQRRWLALANEELAGFINGSANLMRQTSLMTAKVLAALHRRGIAWQTMGDDAMCRGQINPMIVKEQYKFTMIYPRPETQSAHGFGEPPIMWEWNRTIPGQGENPIFLIWRRRFEAWPQKTCRTSRQPPEIGRRRTAWPAVWEQV